MQKIIVGLVRGRHPLPKDATEFIFDEPVTDPTNTGSMYEHALRRLNKLAGPLTKYSVQKIKRKSTPDHEVRLLSPGKLIIYVTGLTPAILAVITAAQEMNFVSIEAKHYNRETGKYFSQFII